MTDRTKTICPPIFDLGGIKTIRNIKYEDPSRGILLVKPIVTLNVLTLIKSNLSITGLNRTWPIKFSIRTQKSMDDLLKTSKTDESNLSITKEEIVNIIISIENIKERLLTKLTSQIQSDMSMQTEQTDVPSQKEKRRGASSRPHSNRRPLQSFEAEPSQWNFADG